LYHVVVPAVGVVIGLDALSGAEVSANNVAPRHRWVAAGTANACLGW
jgi:hypothetical protein